MTILDSGTTVQQCSPLPASPAWSRRRGPTMARVRRRLFLLILLLSQYCSETESMTGPPPPSTRIISNCACGQLHLEFPVQTLVEGRAHAVDCHCPDCRHYHVSGFVSYIRVPREQVSIIGPRQLVRDMCYHVGEVERLQCSKCSSKLATRCLDPEHQEFMLVNMGPLLDVSIPKNYADQWGFYRKQWETGASVPWATATPTIADPPPHEIVQRPRQVIGGCCCGATKYEIDVPIPNEIQHCYCRLCRQLSGGPFMTWMPIWNRDMMWLTDYTEGGFPGTRRYDPPPLTRTTTHGQRHICPKCKGALTIVYDGQPEMTWPAVGGYNSRFGLPTDPQEMNDSLYRAIHICCYFKPTWYTIPQDGLPRVAGPQ